MDQMKKKKFYTDMSQVSFFDEINTTTFIFEAPRCQPEMKRLLPAAAVFVAW